MDPLQWSGAAGPRDVELTKGRDDMAQDLKADDKKVIANQRAVIGLMQEELARAAVARDRAEAEVDRLLNSQEIQQGQLDLGQRQEDRGRVETLTFIAAHALGGYLARPIGAVSALTRQRGETAAEVKRIAAAAVTHAEAVLELIEPTKGESKR